MALICVSVATGSKRGAAAPNRPKVDPADSFRSESDEFRTRSCYRVAKSSCQTTCCCRAVTCTVYTVKG